jgi:hypothetical protein
MKINKDEMKRLAEKGDAELWAEILSIAKSHGYNLSGTSPRPEDLEKIRRALLGVEKISLADATRIMNNYKKRQ